MTYLAQIQETAEWIQAHTALRPQTAIVLGTGLGKLAQEIDVVDEFPYKDIPNFPVSTVEGHSGRLIFGHLGGKPIMALEGRFHYYEGYTMQEVTFPERVMYALGIKNLFFKQCLRWHKPRLQNRRLNADYGPHQFPTGAPAPRPEHPDGAAFSGYVGSLRPRLFGSCAQHSTREGHQGCRGRIFG